MLALWLAVALQSGAGGGGPAPDVTARVDRAHVTAGESLLLTVRARSRSPQPVTLTLPALTGFTVVGSREITEVTLETLGGPVRITTRELELRAQRPGALVIGPVRVQQGDRAVTSAALTVTVDSAAPGLATAVSPIARRLIESGQPPAEDGSDHVVLNVILPADSVLVGQQLDVVAVAWFPRELRERLRRPPILSMQTPEGVWSYPGAAPSQVVASRQVHGRWLDGFVAHEAVFPLAPGRVVIPPATVEYAVPAGFSFFSREDSYILRSDSVPVTILPLHGAQGAGGVDDPPAVAQDLALDLEMDPPSGRVGEPMAVTATLAGVGNVALWPEPALHWPKGFRAYGGETSTRIEPRDGRVAGTKTFHYLVMPDSAGSFVLPAVRYPYYRLASAGSALAAATLPPRPLSVAVGAEPRAARALPPLERAASPLWTEETARDFVPWGWLVLLVGPPLIAWLWRRRRPLAPIRVAPPATPPLSRIGRAEREFHALLASHVPDVEARDGDGLGRALRAAGVESAVADHVMRLRDRLRSARYGPRRPGVGGDLAAELEQVLRVLGADAVRKGCRVVAVLLLAMLGALTRPGEVAAQALNAEALYDAGALRAAADSFAARATAEPRVPAHWYNLGATLYRAGADGKATAAWAIAARLAPRDPLVQRARELLPAPDAPSEPLLAVGWATPAEWALAAAALWVVLWIVAAGGGGWRRRPVLVTVLALLAAGAAGLGVREAARRARPIAVVVQPATSVRVAPYGSASAAATVEAGAALLVVRTYGRWLEVTRSDGVHGWVLAAEVTRL